MTTLEVVLLAGLVLQVGGVTGAVLYRFLSSPKASWSSRLFMQSFSIESARVEHEFHRAQVALDRHQDELAFLHLRQAVLSHMKVQLWQECRNLLPSHDDRFLAVIIVGEWLEACHADNCSRPSIALLRKMLPYREGDEWERWIPQSFTKQLELEGKEH